MTHALAIASAALLALASSWHFYWALGGRVGVSVALPQRPDGTPVMRFSRIASGLAGCMFAGMAVMPLAVAGLLPAMAPQGLARFALCAQAAMLLARGLAWHRYVGLFKTVRSTGFGRLDTRLLSPGFTLAGLGSAWVCLDS